MIIKSYNLNKLNIKKDKNKFILFYGENEGLKNEALKNILKDKENISNFDEKNILDNQDLFMENILSKSFFEKEKIIIIKRATDKILKLIEEIINKNIEDLIIILDSNNLEKKSKLRTFFEKSKNDICIPFYSDNHQTLFKLAADFLKNKKIILSSENINLITSKSNGDRRNLLNELEKLEFYNKKGKKINEEIILKLINLIEDNNISELIDNCLAKNTKKTIGILNENNFTNEDCVLITRVFLNKSKRVLKLCREYEKNQNIELTISSAKPPIFWKDKEITKQQIYKWKSNNIIKLIYKINEIELLIKKNYENSINLITDFIMNDLSTRINN